VSEYGPALFLSRIDAAGLSDDEQATVLRLVQTACHSLQLTDDEGRPVKPEIYDYDEYEKDALGVLLYSSVVYGEMPEEVRADEEEGWEAHGARLAAEIEKHAPGVYRFVCHGVEN
jgi:hypothetical protein